MIIFLKTNQWYLYQLDPWIPESKFVQQDIQIAALINHVHHLKICFQTFPPIKNKYCEDKI